MKLTKAQRARLTSMSTDGAVFRVCAIGASTACALLERGLISRVAGDNGQLRALSEVVISAAGRAALKEPS